MKQVEFRTKSKAILTDILDKLEWSKLQSKEEFTSNVNILQNIINATECAKLTNDVFKMTNIVPQIYHMDNCKKISIDKFVILDPLQDYNEIVNEHLIEEGINDNIIILDNGNGSVSLGDKDNNIPGSFDIRHNFYIFKFKYLGTGNYGLYIYTPYIHNIEN